MKRLLLSTLLGMLALAATAQTQADRSVRIGRYQIELPTKVYKMFPGDFDIYKGVYDLSNGDTMTLRSFGRHIYADVGDRPRSELVAADHNVFVAVDRQLKMTLSEDTFGQVTGEVVMVVPRQSAQTDGATVEVLRLVASR
jgi:hypothetical protein